VLSIIIVIRRWSITIIAKRTGIPKMAKISDCYRVANAAHHIDVPPVTIRKAVERGEIKTEITACGLTLISRREIERWAKKAPEREARKKIGRPKKKGADSPDSDD